MIVNYFVKAEQGALNTNKNVQYFIVEIDVQPHTHPLYIGSCINEKMQKLELAGTHYSKVIATWSGDIVDQLNDVKEKLSSDNNWIDSYRRDLIAKEKELSAACEIMFQNKEEQHAI